MKFLFVYVVFVCNFGQLIYLFNLKFNKMKKVLVLSVVAIAAAFAFSSCTPKDCVCKAIISDRDVAAIVGTSADFTIEGADLKTAGYKNCSDYYNKEVKPREAGVDYGWECVEE